MSNWFPKNNVGLGASSMSQSKNYIQPKPELPEVGDTVLIATLPYGNHVIGEGSQVPNGTDVIELEVKAIKKATLTIE